VVVVVVVDVVAVVDGDGDGDGIPVHVADSVHVDVNVNVDDPVERRENAAGVDGKPEARGAGLRRRTPCRRGVGAAAEGVDAGCPQSLS
jgi:hypothetical protein